jgi:membrane protease YdiL (CAAX protease family)
LLSIMSPPSISRTLLRALLWLVVAFFAGTLGAFVVGFVCGLINGAKIGVISQANLQGATFIGALICAAFAFDRGARREAGRSADASVRASVERQPIRRWPVVALATILLTPFAIFLAVALARVSPATQQANLATNPALLAMAALLVTTVTPFAEETFFRGWLWTALSLRTGMVGAAFLSGFLFLFAHATEALLRGQIVGAGARALILLPLAIGLSIVRALYNFAVVAAPPLLVRSGLLGG